MLKLILTSLVIVCLSGCTIADVTSHIDAHATIDANGNVVGVIGLKDARKTCRQCNDIAVAQIKSTSKAAIDDINATKKAELARLKIERKKCDTVVISQPVVIVDSIPVQSTPQPGDVVVPADTNSDGSFSIPGEKGLFRVERRCQIINGTRVCK